MAENNLWTAIVTGIVSVGVSVGSFGFVLRGQAARLKDQDEKLKKFDVEKLNTKEHVLICENRMLSLKAHITDTMKEFKDEIMEEIRKIQP